MEKFGCADSGNSRALNELGTWGTGSALTTASRPQRQFYFVAAPTRPATTEESSSILLQNPALFHQGVNRFSIASEIVLATR